LLLLKKYDKLYCMNELRTHIVVDPEIRFGKPCIKGTRITIGDILQWLSGGMTEQEIIADYPELQRTHIRAALAFAAERDTNNSRF
jgi:uncharacterized protein (DUF433 family)